MAKRGPKRDKHQKAKHQAEASKLRLEGKTYQQIGDALDISREQVRLDLVELDKSLFEDAKANLEKIKAEQLAKLRHAQVLSLKSFHKSCENKEKYKTEETDMGVKSSTTIEGQSGNPTHLSNYIKAVESESKLLGVYENIEDESKKVKETLEGLSKIIQKASDEFEGV